MIPTRYATMFIGSSVEGLEYARAIENNFFHDAEVELYPWYREFRTPMLTTMEQLERLKTFDFAVFVLTPDDFVTARGDEEHVPRDNLVYELGITVASLGRERVFPLKPHNSALRLPSDLLGVNPLGFHLAERNADARTHEQAVAVACNQIRDRIRQIGPVPSRIGETSTGVRSGIRFHPKIALDESAASLSFRIGYRGPGTLIDVRLEPFFFEVVAHKEGSSHACYLHSLDTTNKSLPEIMYAITNGYSISPRSPLADFLAFDENSKSPTLESLHLLPGRLTVYVRGTDSTTLAPQFAKKQYEPTAIEPGTFRRFLDINEKGDVTRAHWDNFDKFLPLTGT